jgi:hypothetical protein
MDIFEILSKVEDQTVQIEKARAVLQAGTEEVEDYRKYKGFRDEYAVLLLHVADGLLHETLPELQQAVDALLEHHKAMHNREV